MRKNLLLIFATILTTLQAYSQQIKSDSYKPVCQKQVMLGSQNVLSQNNVYSVPQTQDNAKTWGINDSQNIALLVILGLLFFVAIPKLKRLSFLVGIRKASLLTLMMAAYLSKFVQHIFGSLSTRYKVALWSIVFIFAMSMNTFAQTGPNDDFDGDGIINSLDIDDDNDGILDVMEVGCGTIAYSESFEGILAYRSAAIYQPGVALNGQKVNSPSAADGSFSLLHNTAGGTYAVGDEVWGTTTAPTVSANKIYTFSFYLQNQNTISNAQIEVYINNVKIGGPVTAPGSGTWTKYTFVWYSGSSVTANLSLRNLTSTPNGNDFYLDGITLCQAADTDADGIADILDLDSDGDGCSDAYEAGATTNKTANFKFTSAVGTNGLANSLETVADNGIINYTSTYVYAFNASKNLCVDSDGDGIGDLVDIDDDNDGIPDVLELPIQLVLLHESPGTFDVWRMNGYGTFGSTRKTQSVTPPTGGFGNININEATLVADYNKDGIPDVLYIYEGNNIVNVYFGKKDGTYQLPALTTTITGGLGGFGNSGNEVTFSEDVTGDGYPDLLHAYSNIVSVWKNNGNGTFASTPINTTITAPTGTIGIDGTKNTFLNDVTGDGNADLVFIWEGNNIVTVWKSNGDGTFQTTPTTSTVIQAPGGFGSDGVQNGFLKDVTGDGTPDLIYLYEAYNKVNVWKGNGNGTFQAVPTFTTVTGVSGGFGTDGVQKTDLVDLTGDGNLDLYYAYNGNISVWVGDGIGGFAATPITTTLSMGPPSFGDDITKITFISTFKADTDGDGVADYLDLDSDGDGCSDAFEGGATVDKTANFKFTGTFGTNGLDNSLETVADNGIINYRDSYSSFAINNARNKCNFLSPGGVITGLGWWFEGDAGVTTSGTAVTKWNDQSPSLLDVTQVTASRQPTNAKYQNFNKVMTFDGSDALNNATGFWAGSVGNTSYNVFAIAKHTSGTGSVNSLFSENTNLGQQMLFMDYGGNTYNGIWASNYAYTPFAASYSGVPQLISSRYNNVGTVKQIYYNAKTQTMVSGGAAAAFNGNGSNLVLGNYIDQGSWPLNGDIAEIAMYATDLTATQRQQVESYLAIKWGVTLDQTTAYNYLNSSGGVIWNATANIGYKSNIIGIGRDDAAGLNQKQSQSVISGYQPAIGLGTGIAANNAANTNTFAADKSFDIIGDNGAPATFTASYAPSTFTPVAQYYRMNRIWTVQETGTVGTVTIRVPAGADRLLVSTTASFVPGANTQEIPLTSDGAGNVTAQVDLTSGQFFTFGRLATGPGGVVTTTYSCNLVQNGSFTAPSLAAWTNTGNWFDNGAYAHINVDNNSGILKQSLSGLNTTTTPNQIQLNFDIWSLNIGVPSTLEIWLGGTKYASYVINNGSSIVGTAFNSATLSVTSLTNNVWSRGVLLTIPWVSKPNTGDLEFRFTAGNSDFGIDNVIISSNNCTGTLGWWYEGNAGITNSGNAVTVWADQSLSSLDVSQATAAKQPTVTKYQNFNPIVTFANNNALNNAVGYWKSSVLNSQYNVFAVAKHTAGTGSVNTLFAENTSASHHSLFYDYGGNMYMGLWGSYTSYTPFAAASNLPTLVSSRYNVTGNVKQLYWNGKSQTMTPYHSGTTAGTFNGNNSNLVIGNHTDQGSWPFEGDIAEIFMYPFDLSATQRQQVESYLAIKWGLTLDQTTAYNYLNSSGAVIWNATANSGFKNDITGIGFDAAADLNQKQSKTVNSSAFVTLALGNSVAATNAANTANFSADKSFEIIGDNGLAARFANPYTPSFATNGLFYYTMSRIWKVQETGTVGTITLSIPFRGNNTYLLINNSATFSSGATEVAMVKDGNGNLTASVNLTDGQYFTFASVQTAPGAIVSGLATWLKADAGVIDGGSIPAEGAGIDSWSDQSFTSTGYNVDQPTAANQPAYYATTPSKLINFNPSLYFDGANDHLRNLTPIFPYNSAYTFLGVNVDEDPGTGYRAFFSSEQFVDWFILYKQGGATGNNGWRPYSAGNRDFGNGNKFAPAGGSNGYYNGTNFTSDASVQNIQPTITGVSSLNQTAADPWNTWSDGFKDSPSNKPTASTTYFFKAFGVGTDMDANGSAFEFWKGRIPEIMAYSRQLSDPEMAKVNTYLAIK